MIPGVSTPSSLEALGASVMSVVVIVGFFLCVRGVVEAAAAATVEAALSGRGGTNPVWKALLTPADFRESKLGRGASANETLDILVPSANDTRDCRSA